MPAVQHRPAVDAELHGARQRGDPPACRRRQGVRRSTARGLLRRPRRRVRPRQPAPVPAAAHAVRPQHPRARRGPAPGVNATKAVNVHTIAIQVPKAKLLANGAAGTDATSSSSVIGVWTTASRQKALVRDRDGVPSDVRPVHAGVAAREPAVQRGAGPDGAQGLLERAAARRRQAVRGRRRVPRAREAAPRALPGRVPEPRRAQRVGEAAAPTCSRSCSPVSRPVSSPASRTSPARPRRTCCG